MESFFQKFLEIYKSYYEWKLYLLREGWAFALAFFGVCAIVYLIVYWRNK